MQEKNSTRSRKPKAGDGTQMTPPTRDANWYGQSQEPQEEFVENDPTPNQIERPPAKESEGRPTFGGSAPKFKPTDEDPVDCR